MARVKYGSIITELKGSIGGQTFQSIRGGFIIRNKPVSPKVRSRVQSGTRTIMGLLAQSWRTLSDAQRTTWSAVAPSYPHTDKFGDPASFTGYQLFIRCNLYLLAMNENPILSGALPDELFVPTDLAFSSSAALEQLDITWTSGAIPADMGILVRASPAISAGRSYRLSDTNIVGRMFSAESSPYDLWKEIEGKYGQGPAAGSRVLASFQVVSLVTGNASQLYNLSGIVAP